MGSKVSSNSRVCELHNDPSFIKSQELKMERWIQLHYQMKLREKALELARTRELFYWLSGFYTVSFFGCLSHYRRTGSRIALMPLVPFTFTLLYYADMSYGSKLHRIHAEANLIMENEHELLHWQKGIPTLATIDEARVEMEMEKKMHPQPL